MVIKNATSGLSVEITAATQYATVYAPGDHPVATLQRRRYLETGPRWRAYLTNGQQVGDGFHSATPALIAVGKAHLARVLSPSA